MSGNRRHLALTVHVVSALGLLGVSTALLVAAVHAATRAESQDAQAIYELLRFLTFGLDLPLASLALLSGLLLALTSNRSIFRQWWLLTKLTLYAATLVLGVGLIGPSLDTMLDITASSETGESSSRPTLITAAALQVTFLVGAATLGVFKPGRGAEPLSPTPR
jgi:hypothetical protein